MFHIPSHTQIRSLEKKNIIWKKEKEKKKEKQTSETRLGFFSRAQEKEQRHRILSLDEQEDGYKEEGVSVKIHS